MIDTKCFLPLQRMYKIILMSLCKQKEKSVQLTSQVLKILLVIIHVFCLCTLRERESHKTKEYVWYIGTRQ